jgi:hypothetical protein
MDTSRLNCLFVFADHQNILGGIMAVDNFTSNLAFFLSEHSLIQSSIPAIGQVFIL